MTPAAGATATIHGAQAGRDVIATTGDVHIHEAPVETISALHQLPPPPRDFTGRKAELTEILDKIDQGGVTISGLRGTGGVGKTALALELAQHLLPWYPDAQFFVELRGMSKNPLSPADAMAHVIRVYYPTSKLPESEAELSKLYCSVLNGKRALVLLDDARDVAQVEPLIPPESCVLLITSRQHFALPGLCAKNLDALLLKDACALLLRIAPRIGDQSETIAGLCGCLPLALRLAGTALAERETLSVADYVRRLQDARKRLEWVEASLALSYDLLTPELQQRWAALSVFPATFDRAGAAAVWGMEADAAQDTLDELRRYSLVEWNETAQRFSLHDLVRLFADARLGQTDRAAAQQRHAAHYKDVAAAADQLYLQGGESIQQGLALFDLEWNNIQAGHTWAEENAQQDKVALKLCDDYPTWCYNILPLRQHPRQRIAWLETALEAARKLGRRQAEGCHLGNLGLAYADLGDARRAIEYHEQALVIEREIGDRQWEGAVLGNLGLAYADLGDARRAIEFYEQDLVIAREIGDRRGEGAVLGNLGLAYAALGDARRAIEYHEQALVIDREIGDRQWEGAVLGNLGIAYKNLGEPRRAIEYHEQALVIDREIGDRRGEGNALFNMSLSLDKLGDRAQAIAQAKAALEILEQIESPHVNTVRQQLTEWQSK